MQNKTILGDCLEEMKNIKTCSVDMILTDLPYGVTARNKWDVVIDLKLMWEQFRRIAKANAAFVFTATQPFASQIITSNPQWFKYDMIWRKQQGTGFLNAKKQPLRNHESILVFYQSQPTYNIQYSFGAKPYKYTTKTNTPCYRDMPGASGGSEDGRRFPLSVVDFPYDKKKIHPTQKPVALFEYLIKMFTNAHDTVLDCCAGSFTTHVAAHNTTRNSICIEKDPAEFAKGLKRIQEEAPSNDTFMVKPEGIVNAG